MRIILCILFFLESAFISAKAEIPSLPYCLDKDESGLILVSTLDGVLSALNTTGSLVWQINTGPGPLLLSNIHQLELTNNGEWIRLIPSLAGSLYKFDGTTIDPIPITANELLRASFRFSDDLVMAGGIDVRTYGVGFRTGTLYYECNTQKCSNKEQLDVDDVLLIERSTHTVRAVEARTGSERWNFSVGLHNIKLNKISCIDTTTKHTDWNLTAILPEGKLRASIFQNNVEFSWKYIFTTPIVRIWRWNGRNLSEVNLFAPRNVPQITTSAPLLASIYLGMYNKQLYIHESLTMQNLLNEVDNYNPAVTESTSIIKIPWKPIPATTEVTEEDSTALSVLNGSEYVNGHGFYLYTGMDLHKRGDPVCSPNKSFLYTLASDEMVGDIDGFSSYYIRWGKQLLVFLVTTIICHFAFLMWNYHHHKQIVILEKPIHQIVTVRKKPEVDNDTFASRYENDFDTLQCLGKGGFGVVFEVKQKIDECFYAIKRITLPNELKSRDRVMREVKALAKLEHQNIVRYFCSWVESPPVGWQEEHDRKWFGDYLDTTSTTVEEKARRSKSVSVNVDVSLDIDKDDEDSYILFEHSSRSTNDITDTKRNAFKDNLKSGHPVDSTSNESRMNNNHSLTDHLKRKIDWKRPGRRHHSWDLTQSNVLKLEKSRVYLYIQMQLCQKASLKEWLSTHLNRDYKFVLNIFSQILEAVEYVHLRGLIHRDLKPSNIFFSLDGQIKVGDFGLVKDMEDVFDFELTKKGISPPYNGHTVEVGTQLYMSPEQLQSRVYDYKVDIYSLGLIFFELLVPFYTEMERIKMLNNVKRNQYPPDFTEKFKDEHILLQSMLNYDPNKRLTTIGIKARPPFNKPDAKYTDDYHYRLNTFQKT